jgi:hypothetical protein
MKCSSLGEEKVISILDEMFFTGEEKVISILDEMFFTGEGKVISVLDEMFFARRRKIHLLSKMKCSSFGGEKVIFYLR